MTNTRKPRRSFHDDKRFVVIVGLDLPQTAARSTFDLRTHEFCHANWGNYFVFVVPEEEKTTIPLGLGFETVACLSPREAFFISTQVTNRRLSFISKSPSKFPATAYLVDSSSVRRAKPSQFHNPVRAIRVIMDDVGNEARDRLEPWFDFGILDIGCVHGWTSVLTCSGLWQTKIWSQCLEAIPDSSLEPTQLVKMSDPQRPFERFPQLPILVLEESGTKRLFSPHQNAKTVDAMGLLSVSQKRDLALCFSYNFWGFEKLTLDERGMRLTRMQLGHGSRRIAMKECRKKLRQLKETNQPDQTLVGACQKKLEELKWMSEFDRGTVSNLMADAGLRNLPPRQAKKFFASMANHAKTFFTSFPDEALEADDTTRQHYEYNAVRFIVPILQPEFHKLLSYNDIPAFERPRGPVTVKTEYREIKSQHQKSGESDPEVNQP